MLTIKPRALLQAIVFGLVSMILVWGAFAYYAALPKRQECLSDRPYLLPYFEICGGEAACEKLVILKFC